MTPFRIIGHRFSEYEEIRFRYRDQTVAFLSDGHVAIPIVGVYCRALSDQVPHLGFGWLMRHKERVLCNELSRSLPQISDSVSLQIKVHGLILGECVTPVGFLLNSCDQLPDTAR